MPRKRLNHYADIVCKMFVGWRMGDDLEALSDLPDGTIRINLLTGVAKHSMVGSLDLYVSKEIQAWLHAQSSKEGMNISEVETGILEIDIDTSKVATNKKKVVMFNFVCRSLLETKDASFEGTLKDKHQWHTRVGA